MDPHTQRLQKLSAMRAWREPDRSIKKEASLLAKQLMGAKKSVGCASDAWIQLAPLSLRNMVSVESMRGGTLFLLVESSAVAFEVDRALRGGLEHDLINAVPKLLRVRTRLGKFQSAPQPRD